jgi:hypothetical protein
MIASIKYQVVLRFLEDSIDDYDALNSSNAHTAVTPPSRHGFDSARHGTETHLAILYKRMQNTQQIERVI